MYIFSSRYIDSISAQFKNLKPHKGTEMHKKNQFFGLWVSVVLSPVRTNLGQTLFANTI